MQSRGDGTYLGPGRQSEEDLEFKARLGYIVRRKKTKNKK